MEKEAKINSILEAIQSSGEEISQEQQLDIQESLTSADSQQLVDLKRHIDKFVILRGRVGYDRRQVEWGSNKLFISCFQQCVVSNVYI